MSSTLVNRLHRVRIRQTSFRKVSNVRSSFIYRGYHSYPDPNDKPIITVAKASVEKTVVKTGQDFEHLKAKFDMSKSFIPSEIAATSFSQQPKTIVSKLENGLTVASQDMPGLMCSIALLIKTGSSSEIQKGTSISTGCAHMSELMAFQSTRNRTHEEIHTEIERLGGMVQCVAQRESIVYFVDVFRNHLEQAVDLLMDTVLNANITETELEEGKENMMFQRDNLPPEMISRDGIVIAAYRNYPVGNTHYCPPDYIPDLLRDTLINFRKQYFTADNCILAASAVDHDELLKLMERKCADILKAPGGNYWVTGEKKWARLGAQSTSPSKYTGGIYVEQRELKEEFVKCAVAFEIGGWRCDDFVTCCVLQQLLGGGSSFSAGGPGKGMYTRLYREVLNRYAWVESSEAFINCHNDVGLLGIDGACKAESVGSMIQVFIDHLLALTIELVTDEELSRAKNMLKSMLFMQLESRLITCEDIARQVMVFGERRDPVSLTTAIDNVTAHDLQRVAVKMFENDPAVSIIGYDVSRAPSYSAIKRFTDSYKIEISKKLLNT